MNASPAIYQIYVDAFARGSSDRSPGRQRGGDLEGALERLDYIASLSVDAIWLTPIFASPSDHGYNITDYFHIDPRLAPHGDQEEADTLFRRFVDAAHARGIGVLLDLPLNHVGHGYDVGAVTTTPEPLRMRPARTRQERGWQRDLKYFDHDHPATRRFLFDVARFWVEEFDVDGYRYDYVHGIDNPFWAELYDELTSIRSDLFVVGEHWDDFGTAEENARDIASRFDIGDARCFDTLFDFPFFAAAVESITSRDPAPVVEILNLCESIYPRPACSMLDNHDTARIGDWLDGDPARIALALRLLAARTGPVCLLYGTETALVSGRPPRRNVDESSRIFMNWDSIDMPLVETTRRLFGARRAHPVIAGGRTVDRACAGAIFVELKTDDAGQSLLTLLNFADEPCSEALELPSFVPANLELAAVCGGDDLAIRDGRLTAPIAKYGGGLYVVLA